MTSGVQTSPSFCYPTCPAFYLVDFSRVTGNPLIPIREGLPTIRSEPHLHLCRGQRCIPGLTAWRMVASQGHTSYAYAKPPASFNFPVPCMPARRPIAGSIPPHCGYWRVAAETSLASSTRLHVVMAISARAEPIPHHSGFRGSKKHGSFRNSSQPFTTPLPGHKPANRMSSRS